MGGGGHRRVLDIYILVRIIRWPIGCISSNCMFFSSANKDSFINYLLEAPSDLRESLILIIRRKTSRPCATTIALDFWSDLSSGKKPNGVDTLWSGTRTVSVRLRCLTSCSTSSSTTTTRATASATTTTAQPSSQLSVIAGWRRLLKSVLRCQWIRIWIRLDHHSDPNLHPEHADLDPDGSVSFATELSKILKIMTPLTLTSDKKDNHKTM